MPHGADQSQMQISLLERSLDILAAAGCRRLGSKLRSPSKTSTEWPIRITSDGSSGGTCPSLRIPHRPTPSDHLHHGGVQPASEGADRTRPGFRSELVQRQLARTKPTSGPGSCSTTWLAPPGMARYGSQEISADHRLVPVDYRQRQHLSLWNCQLVSTGSVWARAISREAGTMKPWTD